jgi:hypothetical protein
MGPLPAAGQWVQLRVPASAVGLEGSTISGMAFTLYGGRATWDAAGRLSSNSGVASASVSVNPTVQLASRLTGTPGVFTLTRVGDTNIDLAINYTLGGMAIGGLDFQLSPAGGYLSSSLVIPAGASSANLRVLPLTSTNFIPGKALVLSISSNANYSFSSPVSAIVDIAGNTVPVKLSVSTNGALLRWDSTSAKAYKIAYKNSLTDPAWTTAGNLTATNSSTSWLDPGAVGRSSRFYMVAQVN